MLPTNNILQEGCSSSQRTSNIKMPCASTLDWQPCKCMRVTYTRSLSHKHEFTDRARGTDVQRPDPVATLKAIPTTPSLPILGHQYYLGWTPSQGPQQVCDQMECMGAAGSSFLFGNVCLCTRAMCVCVCVCTLLLRAGIWLAGKRKIVCGRLLANWKSCLTSGEKRRM